MRVGFGQVLHDVVAVGRAVVRAPEQPQAGLVGVRVCVRVRVRTRRAAVRVVVGCKYTRYYYGIYHPLMMITLS